MVLKFDRYEQEKFNKLNQLDRIEYLVTRDYFEKHISEPSLSTDFYKVIIFLVIVYFLSAIIFLLKPGISSLHLLETCVRLMGFISSLFLVLIPLEYIIYRIKNKKAREYLEKQFFKGKNK